MLESLCAFFWHSEHLWNLADFLLHLSSCALGRHRAAQLEDEELKIAFVDLTHREDDAVCNLNFVISQLLNVETAELSRLVTFLLPHSSGII